MLQLRRFCFALLAGLLLTLVGRPAHATEVGTTRTFGLGFALGDPMALVGKVFIDRDNAVDFGVGFFNLWNRCHRENGARVCGGFGSSVTFHADYLWQFEIVRGRKAKLDWHIGAGGRLWIADHDDNQDLAIAGRMPVAIVVALEEEAPAPDLVELRRCVFVRIENHRRLAGDAQCQRQRMHIVRHNHVEAAARESTQRRTDIPSRPVCTLV